MTRLEEFLSDSEYAFKELCLKLITDGYKHNKDIYDYDYVIFQFTKMMAIEKDKFSREMSYSQKERAFISRIFSFENIIYRLCSYINSNKLSDRKIKFRDVLDTFYNNYSITTFLDMDM